MKVKNEIKRLLVTAPLILALSLSFTACGKEKDEKTKDGEDNKPTVESYEKELSGNTYEGSNGRTYAFDDGKVTITEEGKDDKNGSYTIDEADSDGDGVNDCIAIRITANKTSDSYNLEGSGNEIDLVSGNSKIVLTKK